MLWFFATPPRAGSCDTLGEAREVKRDLSSNFAIYLTRLGRGLERDYFVLLQIVLRWPRGLVLYSTTLYSPNRDPRVIAAQSEHQHTLQVARHFLRVFLHFFVEQSHLPFFFFLRHFLVFFLSLHVPQGSSPWELASPGHDVMSLGHDPSRR